MLWGDGNQRREIIDVADFMRTMLRLADTVEGEVVNIGAGCEHTIREFAALICAEVDYDPEAILYDTSKYVGARSKRLEIGKLRALLPDFASTPLEQGLPPVIAWVRGNLVQPVA